MSEPSHQTGNPPSHKALCTLPDYVLYRHASLVFPANVLSTHRHSIDSFHQPRCRGKESTVKCIINKQVVLSRVPEGPLTPHIGPFATSLSEEGCTLGSIQRPPPRLPEQSVAGIRLCRAISGGFARRDLKFRVEIRRGSPSQDIVRKGT